MPLLGGGRAAPTSIGPIESLAPSPGPGRGRILGAPQALRLAGDLVGPLAEARINAYKSAKDFNDADAEDIGGADAGNVVKVAGAAAAAP
jgi:hypothetical protein